MSRTLSEILGYYGPPAHGSAFWNELVGSPQEGRAFMKNASTVQVMPHRKGVLGGAKVVVDGKVLELDRVDVDRLKQALEVSSEMSPGQVTFNLIFPHMKEENDG